MIILVMRDMFLVYLFLLYIYNSGGVALMNFTDRETSYTRIIEHKHFEQFEEAVYGNPKTVITREYPWRISQDRQSLITQ